jgi:hypothetical protein
VIYIASVVVSLSVMQSHAFNTAAVEAVPEQFFGFFSKKLSGAETRYNT